MDVFWAILIVVTILFFIFVVFPSIISPNTVSVHPRPYGSRSTKEPQQPEYVETKCEKAARQSKEMLNTYYQDASPVVPEDYPRKIVGACPFSKPPSTDLPMVNTPMCITVREQRKLKDLA